MFNCGNLEGQASARLAVLKKLNTASSRVCVKRGFSFRSLTVTAHIALILLIGDSEPRP
jgi:hypothetical protein